MTTSPTDPAAAPTSTSARGGGADVVRRLYEEAINQGRTDLYAELISADFVGPDGQRGVAGYTANVESVRAGFPDIRFHIEEIVDGGDRVAVRWSWEGTHTGSFRGFAPTGKRIRNTGIAIYEIKGGKAVRAVLETDRLGALQALGVLPARGTPPPSPSALQ